MPQYDRALSQFSPDGRIFQVEYAQLPAERGLPVVFYANDNTIAVGIEKRAESKHRVMTDLDKFREVETNIYLAFAGIWPDSLVIIDEAIAIARRYSYSLGEKIDIKKLALQLSNFVQKYTITGGHRPFGVKVVLFGFDDTKPVISLIEPDGNYAMYKGGAIGHKSAKGIEQLESIGDIDPIVAVTRVLYDIAQKDPAKMSVYKITPEIVNILPISDVAHIISSFGQ